MRKLTMDEAIRKATKNYHGIQKEVMELKFRRILEALMTSDTLEEAAQKIGMTRQSINLYVSILRSLGIVNITRGKPASIVVNIKQ